MPSIVKLQDRETAEPNTCGSCRFFYRLEYGYGSGLCQFTFPNKVRTLSYLDSEGGPVKQEDTERCDLYQPSDATFQKLREWKVTPEKK